MPCQQLSPRREEGQSIRGKKTWVPWHFLTLHDGQNSGVAVCPAGETHRRFPKKTREGDLRHSFEKCSPCNAVLEPDTPSSFIDPHVWHVSITRGFGWFCSPFVSAYLYPNGDIQIWMSLYSGNFTTQHVGKLRMLENTYRYLVDFTLAYIDDTFNL